VKHEKMVGKAGFDIENSPNPHDCNTLMYLSSIINQFFNYGCYLRIFLITYQASR